MGMGCRWQKCQPLACSLLLMKGNAVVSGITVGRNRAAAAEVQGCNILHSQGHCLYPDPRHPLGLCSAPRKRQATNYKDGQENYWLIQRSSQSLTLCYHLGGVRNLTSTFTPPTHTPLYPSTSLSSPDLDNFLWTYPTPPAPHLRIRNESIHAGDLVWR